MARCESKQWLPWHDQSVASAQKGRNNRDGQQMDGVRTASTERRDLFGHVAPFFFSLSKHTFFELLDVTRRLL
ncbi:hypothetical protein BC940DRAFT_310619 [Gongronella butleri]|nr:hypothetical protein BC940DRAFT_310619 [Gongronella butleri]